MPLYPPPNPTVSEITDIPTAETDTDLRLAPDGAGGVEWGAGGAGGIGNDFASASTNTAQNLVNGAAVAIIDFEDDVRPRLGHHHRGVVALHRSDNRHLPRVGGHRPSLCCGMGCR